MTGEASTVNSTSLIPRPFAALMGAVALMVAVFATNPNIARGATYVPGEVVVQYAPGPVSAVAVDAATRIGARVVAPAPALPGTQVLRLPRGVSVAQAITRLRRQRGGLRSRVTARMENDVDLESQKQRRQDQGADNERVRRRLVHRWPPGQLDVAVKLV